MVLTLPPNPLQKAGVTLKQAPPLKRKAPAGVENNSLKISELIRGSRYLTERGVGMKALILAGGFATRLGPIGENIPKAMLMIHGDTVLNHQLRKLKEIGLKPYILTNKRFGDFFKGYENVLIEGATREEEKPGAVSAINNFIKSQHVDEDLMVLCSDNYFSDSLKGFVRNYTGEPMLGVYYAGPAPEIELDQMGTLKFEGSDSHPPPRRSFYVEDFKEKSSSPLSEYVGTGIYIFPKSVFSLIDKYCGSGRRDAPGNLIEYLVKSGVKVKGYLLRGVWQDISERSYIKEFSEGRLVKRDEHCLVIDKRVSGLVLILTILHPGGQIEERPGPTGKVYFFSEGKGILKVGDKKRVAGSGDVIPIPPGTPHQIRNDFEKDLVFICVSEGR